MPDIYDKKRRSEIMAQIAGKDTKPEKLIRSYLHSQGFRFRINNPNLPGKPDIVLKKYNAVIFIHGCFWHNHKGCKKSKLPETRKQFWRNKIGNTVKRDKRNISELKKIGWRIAIVWECAIKNKEDLPSSYTKLKFWIVGNEKMIQIQKNRK